MGLYTYIALRKTTHRNNSKDSRIKRCDTIFTHMYILCLHCLNTIFSSVFLNRADVERCLQFMLPLYQLNSSTVRYGTRKCAESVALSSVVFFIQGSEDTCIHCGGGLGCN